MNPVHQRHENRRDTACPVFWRRFGNRFALFLAAYPWIVAVIFMAGYVVRLIRRGQMPRWVPIPVALHDFLTSKHFNQILEIGEVLAVISFILGIFLFLIGLVWFGLMLGAWRHGLVSGWLWIACAFLGFGGAGVVFQAVGLFAR